MPNGLTRQRYIEQQKAVPGADPAEIERQEAIRQGYTRGVEPVPPTRDIGGLQSEAVRKAERRRMKILRGERITQEDL
jgi:hypothetical protein